MLPALLLTALADLFLLVLNDYYILGILIFLGAQIVYLARLYRSSGKWFWLLRLLLPLVIGLLFLLMDMALPMNLLAGLYFSQLLVNMLQAWLMRGRKWRIFAVGLSLFIGCDLCVGIFNTGNLFPEWLVSFAVIGMWLFYLPSQVLIVLSALPEKRA